MAHIHLLTWQRCGVSFLIAGFFGGIEYGVAVYLESASAQADAIHLLADGLQSAFLALMGYLAARHAEGRFAVLGAYVQSALLVAAGIIILNEVGRHAGVPRSPASMMALGAGMTALAFARIKIVHRGWSFGKTIILILRALMKGQKVDLLVVAELSHTLLDLVTSAFVLATGVIMERGGSPRIDLDFGYAIAGVAFASAILVFLLARAHAKEEEGGHQAR